MKLFRTFYSGLFITTNVTGNFLCGCLECLWRVHRGTLPTRHTINWRSSPIDWPTACRHAPAQIAPAKTSIVATRAVEEGPRKWLEVAIASSTMTMSGPMAHAPAGLLIAEWRPTPRRRGTGRDRIEDVVFFSAVGQRIKGQAALMVMTTARARCQAPEGNPPSRSTFRQQLCSASRLRSCRRLTGGGRICAGGVARAAGLP
jgi:hypothetical protein